MSIPEIPPEWEKWCTTGNYAGRTKRKAVRNCLNNKGQVVGYLSSLPLNPKLEYTRSMYPSVEHLVNPNNNEKVAVETRIINDMKSHLNEKEFWQLISHLFFVGVLKGKIKAALSGKHLRNEWKPKNNFKKQK